MSKIKTIRVKNIKSIDEQTLNLSGCSAIITAGNNKGKSTLLTALTDRIRGQKPELILREGQTDGIAEMELTTGERFVWKISGDKEKLEFFTKDGIKVPLVREISKKFFTEKFDIDRFLNESPKNQTKMLQAIVGLDFTDVDNRYAAAYKERTYLNRALDELRSFSNACVVDDALPNEPFDIKSVQAEFSAAIVKNAEIDAVAKKRLAIALEIEQLEAKIVNLKLEVEHCAQFLANNEKVCVEALSDHMAKLNKDNELISKNNQSKQALARVEDAKKKYEAADELVKSIELEKKQKIAQACLPAGFAIADDVVTVNGYPLTKSQLSLSQIYIAALKLAAINMAEVKALYFDASPLDKNSLTEIQAWAKENGLQLLIEKPDFDGGEISYQILAD